MWYVESKKSTLLHREGLLRAKTAWGFQTMEGRNEGTLNVCVINVTHLPAHRHQGKEERKDLFYYSCSSSVVQFGNRLKLDCQFAYSPGLFIQVSPGPYSGCHRACPGLSYTSGAWKPDLGSSLPSRDSGFIGQDLKVMLKGLPVQFPPQPLRALPLASFILITSLGKEERKDLLHCSCSTVFAHHRMSRL